MPASALHSFSKAIEIPARLHNQPLDAWQTSARLTTLLTRFGIRVLGDLHGRKVVEFAWEKNCGAKTLYELDLLARRARFRNGEASCNGHRRGCVHAPHDFTATDSEGTIAKTQEGAASFAIPESICHLAFNELPITTRLANVVRSMGARSLGDLNGRGAFELLQYRACGWGTISEIQQLIERAVSGEFDVAQIEEATAAAELLSLLEQGLAKISLRDRQFVLARIGGEMGNAGSRRADLLCLSYAEIGRRYGLTRARVQKVFANKLDSLRKIWGPRVPRLLEIIKWRCLSLVCPLTPELLQQWIGNSRGSFQISTKAQVRLIAILDETIPCWLDKHDAAERINSTERDNLDLALAHLVCEAGGRIAVAEAYRKLTRQLPDHRRLTIGEFLRILRGVRCIMVDFKDPDIPVARLRAWNGENLRVHVQTDQPSAPRRAVNREAIPFFNAKNGFCERQAAAGR
jgi:hypothetical protein